MHACRRLCIARSNIGLYEFTLITYSHRPEKSKKTDDTTAPTPRAPRPALSTFVLAAADTRRGDRARLRARAPEASERLFPVCRTHVTSTRARAVRA